MVFQNYSRNLSVSLLLQTLQKPPPSLGVKLRALAMPETRGRPRPSDTVSASPVRPSPWTFPCPCPQPGTSCPALCPARDPSARKAPPADAGSARSSLWAFRGAGPLWPACPPSRAPRPSSRPSSPCLCVVSVCLLLSWTGGVWQNRVRLFLSQLCPQSLLPCDQIS